MSNKKTKQNKNNILQKLNYNIINQNKINQAKPKKKKKKKKKKN